MDKKMILKQIKDLINFSGEKHFKDAKLIDGQTIVNVEGDTFEVGKQLSLVTPEGLVPAPVGEHTTIDGDKITVDESGKITAVEKVEVQAEGEITPVEQQLADENFYTWDNCMLDMMDEYGDEQIASAVCGKIKADGYIMSKEEAFAEAATMVNPDTKKEDKPADAANLPADKKVEELGNKIKEMESKIADIEKMMNEVLPVVKQSAEFGNEVIKKLDTFVADTPADKQFASIKSEYKQLVNDNKISRFNGLEGIKNIRKK